MVLRRQADRVGIGVFCQGPHPVHEVLGLGAGEDGELLAGEAVQAGRSLDQRLHYGEAVLPVKWESAAQPDHEYPQHRVLQQCLHVHAVQAECSPPAERGPRWLA